MHILCPHCKNPIELVDPAPNHEVLCTACGSSFHVESNATATWTPKDIQCRMGKFELVEVVGVGSFGMVYKARDTQLDRIVAIKIPRVGNVPSGIALDRFLREARSVAQLRHPSIVPVYEVGQSGSMPYLVSEFVQGLTLADLLTARRPSPQESARLIAEVADALQYAHDRGVVHRDVKPSNIQLDDQQRPHVMDFGLAKREAGEITMTLDGQVLGTPAYMSPEQARGESHKVDGRSDVYSLGVVYYELLSGELPFRGNSRMLLHQVLNEEPRPPRSLNDRIPRDAETICLKAMAKEPSRRYQTARELAEDLRRLLEDQPIRARPVSRPEKLWRWCRRNPTVAGLTTAVALLLLIVSAGATLSAIQYRRSATRDRERADMEAQLRLEEKAARDSAERARKDEQRERHRAEELAESSRQNLYAASIYAAQQAWERGDVERVGELLEGLRPRQDQEDLRGFEWYYLWRLCHGARLTLSGHTGTVRGVSFSPDRKTLATAGEDGTVRLWDVETGRERAALKGHADKVTCVAFAPDGKTLASGSWDQTVRLWDPAIGGEAIALRQNAGAVSSLAFSPDGKTLAVGSGKLAAKVANPLARFFVDSRPGEVQLWDVASRSLSETLKGHTASVTAVAFGLDGKVLVTASEDNTVRVWTPAEGRYRSSATLRGHTGPVMAMAFSPDGQTLATGSWDRSVRLWDPTTGQERATLQGHEGPILFVAFSPDSRMVASGGLDRIARIWEVGSGKESTRRRGHSGLLWAGAYSPDGMTLATASGDGTVKLWDASGSQEHDTLRRGNGAYSLAFARDGRVLALGRLILELWDVADRRQVATAEKYRSQDISVAFAPDGHVLAAAGIDGVVRLWDVVTKDGKAPHLEERSVLRGHDRKVWSLAFAPDGKTLSTGSEDGTAKLWDVETGRELATLKARSGTMVRYVTFASEGKTLALAAIRTSDDRGLGNRYEIELWDVGSRQLRSTLRGQGHRAGIDWMAITPDGRTLAAAGWDKTIKLWDLASGRERATLKGHMDVVYHGIFSPDGKTLATGSWDGTVRLWHVASGQELLTLKGSTGAVVWSVAFSPDGGSLAMGGGFGSIGEVTLWHAPH